MDSNVNAAINRIITEANKWNATHIHLTCSAHPTLRIDDQLKEMRDEQMLTEEFMLSLAKDWLNEDQKKELAEKKSVTFTKNVARQIRAKINFFYQRGNLSAELSLIPFKIPALTALGLPKSVFSLPERQSGLVVIAGSVGSGRSTTLAAILEEINKVRKEKIMTVERPIEYLFSNNQSIFEQREVPTDSNTFVDSIRYAQHSDVDILVVTEDSEDEIVPELMEFVNSGRLAFLIMDASSSIQALEQILARFAQGDQRRAQLLLSETLQSVIVQRLLPKTGGGIVLAAEVLMRNEAVTSLIAENKMLQLQTIIQSSRDEGMISFDQSLAELVKKGYVLIDRAIVHAKDQEYFRKMAI